jgi:hypothetical protein
MNYFIKRDLNEYGPYSLADLQKYVASGNILLTDLCRSEGLTDWVPVSQVIGNIPVPVAPQPAAGAVDGSAAGASGYAAVAVSQYPAPPNLHWGICILLTIITCTIFAWVWAFVQAVWVRKVQPQSKGLILYSVALGIHFLRIAIGLAFGISLGLWGSDVSGANIVGLYSLSSLLGMAILGLIIFANFNMKESIEEHYNTAEPIGLNLSGVMTFFFGVLYFQYHFTRINEMKQQQMMGYRP